MNKIITRRDAEKIGLYEVIECSNATHIVYNLDDAINLAKSCDYKRGNPPDFLTTVYGNGVRLY